MDENNELLEYIHENSEMGAYSTEKLLKELDGKDNKIKKDAEDLLHQYQKFTNDAAKYLSKNLQEAESTNMMNKVSASVGIKKEVGKDNSDANIAGMLIQGLTMGIVEINVKIENFKNSADKKYIKFANEFLEFQEKEIEKFKKYL